MGGRQGRYHRRRPDRSGNLRRGCEVAVGETVILLPPPPPLVGVSTRMERERQHNDSLATGSCEA